MIHTLKFLLSSQLKRSRLKEQVGGFTLIELLVAMILAFLILTPLLGFMLNILNTDGQEQAKANSEQEIQASLDFMTRDLEQAVYIYDATGIAAIASQLPANGDATRVPVLVFWKREIMNQKLSVGTGKDDSFVYALVAYYLIQDTNTNWSNAARIARWEIRDGVQDPNAKVGICTAYPNDQYASTDTCPSDGFQRFSLDGVGTIQDKMNHWKQASAKYTDTPQVLVDFIDQTTNGAPAATTCASGLSTVPPASLDKLKMTSFYACVDNVNTTAQVFLRGNALARLQNTPPGYTDSEKTYFPSASIRVQGHGYLFTK